MSEPTYNPLDTQNLGDSVVKALLRRPILPLPPPAPFAGAGLYAIYCVGGFAAYASIAASNRDGKFEARIYVGKAIPKGTRKGSSLLGTVSTPVLHGRLRQHADSISQARNVGIADFYCRYLLLDEIWIPLGESLLIDWFAPVWNCTLDGFGIHDPGGGRYRQQESAWDTVHPGRLWANRCAPNRRTAEDFLGSVAAFPSSQARNTVETARVSARPRRKSEDVKLVDRQTTEGRVKRSVRKPRKA